MTGATPSAADWFDLFDPGLRRDPYPAYHRLRAESPVHRLGAGLWAVARYDDALLTLRDHRFGRDFGDAVERAFGQGESAWLQRLVVLNREPPAHTRARALLARALPARPPEALRARVRDLVDRLLAPGLARRQMDVVAEVARPLPLLVISELMGLGAADRRRLEGWTGAIAPLFDVVVPAGTVRRADAAIAAFAGCLRPLVARRRGRPRGDLLSALAAAEGDALTGDEVIANAILLAFAGHETTSNLIGNGLLALLRAPAQLDRLRADDDLLDGAVEEMLRYDSPGQLTARIAREEVELGGRVIRRGDVVLVLIGAANRDPSRFVDPDVLDVGRAGGGHLSFGGGHHLCLGAGLARLEARAAIGAVLRGMPGLRLDTGPLEWRESVNLRGLRALRVAGGRAEAPADSGPRGPGSPA